MKYTTIASSSEEAIKKMTVTRVWGNDGWCYLPELLLRQKMTETDYYQESWNGVISMPEHIEKIEWKLLSMKPRMWSENGVIFQLLA